MVLREGEKPHTVARTSIAADLTTQPTQRPLGATFSSVFSSYPYIFRPPPPSAAPYTRRPSERPEG